VRRKPKCSKYLFPVTRIEEHNCNIKLAISLSKLQAKLQSLEMTQTEIAVVEKSRAD
jgi:hypothetical protein